MKKRDLFMITVGFILCLCVSFIAFYTNRKMQKEEQYYELKNSNLISMMIQNDTGEYEKADRTDWPTEGYNFNKTLSKCENGSHLAWRNDKVVVNTTTSDKCYIYFDLENGTEQFPYQIDSIEDLVRLSNDVNGGDTKANKTYILTRDLDFQDPDSYEDSQSTAFGDINGVNNAEPLIEELTAGTGFKPIGSSLKTIFNGNFDGKNHYIKNLYIENNNLKDDVGLFGAINNSTISNIIVTGKIHTLVTANIGGIAGRTYASTLKNVQFGLSEEDSYVISDTNEYNAGGIVGAIYSDTNINNSKNYGNVSNSAECGGIAGWVSSNSTLTINNCQNYGVVENNKGVYIGGFVGRNFETIEIFNSSNHGDVKTNTAGDIGGFIGLNYGKLTIENSYNTGNIYNENINLPDGTDLNLGGFIGSTGTGGKEVKINNSYNLGNVINGTRVGGIIGYTYNQTTIIINKVYNMGNISNTPQSWTVNFGIGGLIGYTNVSNTYILNSYNTYKTDSSIEGTISGNKNTGGGLIGTSTQLDVVVNSYNKGNVSKNNGYAHGIAEIEATTYINNVYNIGKINGNRGSYGIGYYENLEPDIQNINNAYYLDNVSSASNISVNATSMTEQQMKNQSFVDTLNGNIASVEADMKEKYPILNDYTLSRWKLGEDSYPTLVNE